MSHQWKSQLLKKTSFGTMAIDFISIHKYSGNNVDNAKLNAR